MNLRKFRIAEIPQHEQIAFIGILIRMIPLPERNSIEAILSRMSSYLYLTERKFDAMVDFEHRTQFTKIFLFGANIILNLFLRKESSNGIFLFHYLSHYYQGIFTKYLLQKAYIFIFVSLSHAFHITSDYFTESRIGSIHGSLLNTGCHVFQSSIQPGFYFVFHFKRILT